MLEIANPIYDSVFKYMLDDHRIAKFMISAIIGEKIIDLEPSPQEIVVSDDMGTNDKNNDNDNKDKAKTPPLRPSFAVYRLDYSATIKGEDGHKKKVLIEIQKAKLPSDIMRFRQYLGSHYSNKHNVYTLNKKTRPMRIIGIYFLGYNLDCNIDCPIIKTSTTSINAVNKKPLNIKDPFIDSMTHDCFTIQIQKLKQKYQTDLETFLTLFKQNHTYSDNHHVLTIDPDCYPKKYQTVIRRLQEALASKKVKKFMLLEDDYLKDLQDIERESAKKSKIIEEKDKALEENKKTLEEKEQVLEEKNQVIEENKKILEENKTIIEELKTIVP